MALPAGQMRNEISMDARLKERQGCAYDPTKPLGGCP